ncbi:Ig-like protein group 3 [Natranaerovirga pectinivora]|uniref:Ig-like protein group 3 n=1 Tax=Natranaerovirga pectinivora TaxID=682400 RepID=A0A4R3MP22_9FIRM|nr:bacterial Ig-like domain-containing protein [Natranaerovirga pectinivora]TCT13869.1 Ig-like protein group 3 [Natranaerovirga pectinivora]
MAKKRVVGLIMSLVLVFSSMSLTVLGQESVLGDNGGQSRISTENEDIEGEVEISDWEDSFFGDIGGAGSIDPEHYEVTPKEDGSVFMRVSNNKGKIASSADGLAFYYKEIPSDLNFEISATAEIIDYSVNNQVSFGLMIRDEVLKNESDGSVSSDYIAAGPLGLARDAEYTFTRKDGTLSREGLFSVNPVQGDKVDISIQKVGNTYILTVGDEAPVVIENFDFAGNSLFAGLYVVRNATVNFTNVKLNIEGQLGDWEDSFFGDIGGQDKINPVDYEITPNEDGTLRMRVSNNRGKIAGSTDGLAFYYKEVPANLNFEITAKAKINEYSVNNQVSFGLMVRDEILHNISEGTLSTDYVAAGPLGLARDAEYTFSRKDGSLSREGFFGVNPVPGDVLDLSIRKAGNTYVLTVGNEEPVVYEDFEFAGNTLYVGMYAVRNADITFSDFDIKVDARRVTEVEASVNEGVEILLGQELESDLLDVSAVFSDGSKQALSGSDYIVTGYDSSEVGTTTVTINYNGVTTTVDIDITALTATELSVKYFPAKTDYYIGDRFDADGFEVTAVYNDGYLVKEISEDLYEFIIEDVNEEGAFTSAGVKTITVVSTETPETTTSFEVNVSNATLTGLDIRQLPQKTLYFIDDELELDGMVVYSKYSDGNQVRLLRNEYVVSELDTSEPGSKRLTLSHKDFTTDLTLEVKVKELVGIEVTEYPKTTYFVGENFDATGLVVSQVYDNEDREVIENYTIDTDAFDSSQAGVYELVISSSVGSTVLKVTVREGAPVEWHSIIFGQSAGAERNQVNVLEDGTIELSALGNAGKVTGDQDGISYYYTILDPDQDNFVLSADIKVIRYAKSPHDGQESFGIMARDAIGTHLDASVFSSNIAVVGGYSGGTTLPNGTQLYVRTGVVSSDGERLPGHEGRQSIMIKEELPTTANTYPEQDYRLTLSKTNSGYVGQLNNGEEVMFFEPDILSLQDSDNLFVGFFTAREAHIEVSNIEFAVTATETDAPKVEAPLEAIDAAFEVVSLERTSETNYNFMLEATASGTVTIKQGQEIIATDAEVIAGETFALTTEIPGNDKTNFSVTFLPDDTQLLTSYDKIVQNFTVENRIYLDGEDIYVSPTGTPNGSGTEEDPVDLDTAIDFVLPGQRILMLDGHYVRDTRLVINKYNDGTERHMKFLVAAPGARPVIDFDRRVAGALFSGNYWYIEGMDFARSAGNSQGVRLGGSHNIINNARFYENGDTGMQISRTDLSMDINEWPSHNIIANSVSFDNRDPSGNNADGFAAKLTSGYGNIFIRCIAHNNIDDGWDLYTKVGEGAIGPVQIIDSISYNNGFLTDGTVGNGKNGFKLGGEGVHVPHILKNSVAFGNGSNGISSNSNPGLIIEDSISFNNQRNVYLYTYTNIQTDFQVDGLVSFHQNPENSTSDTYPGNLESDRNYFFDGNASLNASGEEAVLTDADFAKLNNLTARIRDDKGNINWDAFYEIVAPFLQ